MSGISVVISTRYEENPHLDEALESVASQTRPAREIIVVGYGPSSPRPVRARGVKCLDVSAFAGVAQARNQGARMASGEYVAFLDDDGLWEERHLEKLEDAIASWRPDCLVTGLDRVEGGGTRSYRCEQASLRPEVLLVNNPGTSGSSLVVRRDALDDLSGFDERLNAESSRALLVAMSRQGFEVRAAPDIRARLRSSAGSRDQRAQDPSGFVWVWGEWMTASQLHRGYAALWRTRPSSGSWATRAVETLRHRALSLRPDRGEIADALPSERSAMTAKRWSERWTRGEVAALCDSFAGRAPSRLELLGSSNGTFSYRVEIGPQTFKCYQCLSAGRAAEIELLSHRLASETGAVPRTLARRGRLLLVEWVEGETLTREAVKDSLEEVAACQARLHLTSLPAEHRLAEGTFHFDWLLKRLAVHAGTELARGELAALSRALRLRRPADSSRGILNPDLVPGNFVRNPGGELVVVDNELLSSGMGQEWDVLITAKLLRGDAALKERYIELYLEHNRLPSLVRDRAYWEAWVRVRRAGRRFRPRRVAEAREQLAEAWLLLEA
jgi:hypothetical protein